MPRVPDHIVQQSLGAPGSAAGVGDTMLATVKAAAGFASDAIEATDSVLSVYEEQQQLENKRSVISARQQMRENLGDLKGRLDPTNPNSWVADFDESAGEWKKNFEGKNMPPVVRDRIAQEAGEFFSRARQSLASDALQKNTTLARKAGGDEVNHATGRGDWNGARERLGEMRKDKLIDEPDFKKQSRQIDREEFMMRFKSAAEKAPQEALALLDDSKFLDKNPSLTTADQNTLRKHSQKLLNTQNSNLWRNALNNALDDDEPAILDDQALKGLVDDGVISPQQRAAYKRNFHEREEDVRSADPALFSQAAASIRQYDPDQDPDGFHLANLREQIALLPLPKAHQKELSKLLTAQTEKDGGDPKKRKLSPALKGVQKSFSKLTGEYFNEGRFGSWFSMEDHDNDASTAERKVITHDEFTKASVARAEFEQAWSDYLEQAPDDLSPEQANEDFKKMFQNRFIDNGENPFDSLLPNLPDQRDFGADAQQLLPGVPAQQGAKVSRPSSSPVIATGFSSLKRRQEISQAGGAAILTDFNSTTGKGITEPLMVVPDNASPAQIAASKQWTDGLASLINRYTGRKVKGHVRMKYHNRSPRKGDPSRNERGRKYAFHHEPFALTDAKMVSLMTRNPQFQKEYLELMGRTLSKMPGGAHFFLPHGPKGNGVFDPGAVANGYSEVSMARFLYGQAAKPDLPPTSMTAPREDAQREWFNHAKPTSPAEIRAGLDDLDYFRSQQPTAQNA